LLLSTLAIAVSSPDQPRLDPASAADLVAAFRSCSRAVTGRTKVNHSSLEADGWKQDEVRGIWMIRRKPGNAATITANRGQSGEFPGNLMQEVCVIRARPSNPAFLETVAANVTDLIGVQPIVSERERHKGFWPGASVFVAQEPFEPAPDGSPITQMMVMPSVETLKRLTQDASSQNKNQEPR
jgi:hypothetical protein